MMSTILAAAATTVSCLSTYTMGALSKLTSMSFGRWIFIISLLINIKVLPFCWHFRFYRSLFRHFYFRRHILPNPTHLFSPVITASRSPLYDCDLNGHKSNSTYFADLDIARAHLMAALSKRSFSGRKKRGDKMLYVALAGVTCSFKKEIKPFAKYEISTRVLGWDKKWVFLVSHFITPKDKEGNRRVLAVSLSKYVYKAGRVTVDPEVVLRESGLIVGGPLREGGMVEGFPGDAKETEKNVETDGISEAFPGEAALESEVDVGPLPEASEYWTPEKVEAERLRGLKIAQHFLGLDDLLEEFRDGNEEGLTHVGEFSMAC